jgi:uncharacterized membrane-anchored protein
MPDQSPALAPRGRSTGGRAVQGLAPAIVLAVAVLATSLVAYAQQQSPQDALKEVNSLAWQSYPNMGILGDVAQIRLTNGVRFLDVKNTSRFVELNGNLPTSSAYTIAPPTYSWFAIFEFDAVGYVKDDDKIDPDELLKTLQEQNEKTIEERKRRGLKILNLTGWFVEPHYDLQTKRLEWGTRLVSEKNDVTVNYSIRILGRTGVMRAVLVSDPDSLEKDVQTFRAVLKGFDFVPGQQYAEFKSGDKVAEYGLAALIVGGAADVAAESGIGKALFKFIGIGALAAFAAVVAFFKRLFGSRKQNPNKSV